MDNPRQVAAENRNLRRKPKPPPNTSYTTTKPAIQNPIIFFSSLSLNFPSTQTKGKKKKKSSAAIARIEAQPSPKP